jgi:hypothetical protein
MSNVFLCAKAITRMIANDDFNEKSDENKTFSFLKRDMTSNVILYYEKQTFNIFGLLFVSTCLLICLFIETSCSNDIFVPI